MTVGTAAKRKTIAHIMPWSGMGGVEIATLRLVEATQAHFRHIAFCFADAVELQATFAALDVPTFIYQEPMPSLRHGLRFFRQSQGIARDLRRQHVDLVHFAELKAAQHVSLAALLAGAQRVSHVRVSHPVLSRRERLTLLPVQRFLFVSKEARDTFALPLRPGRAQVLYDAIALPELDIPAENRSVREEFNWSLDTPVIGMVARISPQKDYFTLGRAMVAVLAKSPQARFLLVGDNALVPLNREHFAEVQAFFAQLGIADRVVFTGHRTDVPRLVCAMDFCVLATHREGFPLSILETMSLGKPSVATDVGGIAEIVEPGVTGFLHAQGNSEQLAAAILRLLEDPALCQRLGAQARERVRTGFGPERYVRELTAFYEHGSRPAPIPPPSKETP